MDRPAWGRIRPVAYQVERAQDGEIQILQLRGSVDALSASDLDKTLQAALAAAESRIVVDLSSVDFVSSAGFGSLLAAGRTSRRTGAKMIVCGVHGSAEEAIKVLGIAEFFTMAPDRASALALLR